MTNKKPLAIQPDRADHACSKASRGRSQARENPTGHEFYGWLLIATTCLGIELLPWSFISTADAAPSRCSEPATIKRVRELEGENSPTIKLYESMGARVVFSLDAIRTVSSLENGSTCAARLTLSFFKEERGVPPDIDANGDEKFEQVAPAKSLEVEYKIEVTDDGQNYVTIIPSEASITEQQNRQQRLQQQQYDQEQRSRAFEQESINRQEQYRRDLQEQWRQR